MTVPRQGLTGTSVADSQLKHAATLTRDARIAFCAFLEACRAMSRIFGGHVLIAPVARVAGVSQVQATQLVSVPRLPASIKDL